METKLLPSDRGFSLIELMVALAIMAILLGIAIPSYQDYVLRSRIRTAQGDLVALALNVENALQRSLAYPSAAAADTAAVRTRFPGWNPAQGADFNYAYTPTAAGGVVTGYTLTAAYTGTSARLTGCVVTLTDSNARSNNANCTLVGGTW